MYRILIIENKDSVYLSLNQILSEISCEILHAKYGETGILKASKHLPDIIICGEELADMNGYDVLQSIREIDTLLFSNFYLLLKNKKTDIIQKVSTLGLSHFFQMPLDKEFICNTIVFQQKRKEQIQKEVRLQALQEIQHNLHDGIKQKLIHTHFTLDTLTAIYQDGLNEKQRELIENASQNTQDALGDIQWISTDSIHPLIEQKGLISALKASVKSLNKWDDLTIYFESNVDNFLESQLHEKDAIQLYYFILEAISNASKHANASELKVNIFEAEKYLNIQIEDNGIGFDEIHHIPKSLVQRANFWKNSELLFESRPKKGLIVSLKIPMKNISKNEFKNSK